MPNVGELDTIKIKKALSDLSRMNLRGFFYPLFLNTFRTATYRNLYHETSISVILYYFLGILPTKKSKQTTQHLVYRRR